jgi:hypothetical protein
MNGAIWAAAAPGQVEITPFVYRQYRIKPNDARGILQMSETGNVAGDASSDFQDLARGIVDLQIAVMVFDPSAASVPTWYSSENMESPPAGSRITQVAITLLAKSTREVRGVRLANTPDLTDGTNLTASQVGDVRGRPLPEGSPAPDSPYVGDWVYRTYTTRVELRNVVGN